MALNKELAWLARQLGIADTRKYSSNGHLAGAIYAHVQMQDAPSIVRLFNDLRNARDERHRIDAMMAFNTAVDKLPQEEKEHWRRCKQLWVIGLQQGSR